MFTFYLKAAEARGDPQPNFSYPYIADWPRILQNITMKRIRKIRAADRANILIQKRAFRGYVQCSMPTIVIDNYCVGQMDQSN